ncbi:CBM_collapsed_G0017920.mRNA.1.CDS.1 [Saccharomyces cerevisiae]|nr:CBM_collapsed_G0017920.mRNA.1.CDS.1 [Saccharomyces cerevisiae]
MYTQIKQVWSDNVEEQVLHFERISNATTNGEILPGILDLPVGLKNSEDLFQFAKRSMDIKDTDEGYESIELMNSSFRKLSIAATRSITRKEVNSSINPNLSDTAALNNDYMETISLLVNSNWLTEMLSMLNFNKDGIFDTSLQNVKKVFDVEKESYASFLLRDTMPKLTAFVYGVSNIIENTNNVNMTNPSRWAAYSRQNLENILLAYTSHEIETLVKRLHTHMVNDFGYHQENAINNVLCDKLWSCIQGQTVSLYLKLYTVIDKHYRGTNIRFTKNDIISAFEEYKNA